MERFLIKALRPHFPPKHVYHPLQCFLNRTLYVKLTETLVFIVLDWTSLSFSLDTTRKLELDECPSKENLFG